MRHASLLSLLGPVALAGVAASVSCQSEPEGPPPITDVAGVLEVEEDVFDFQCECFAQFEGRTPDECREDPTRNFNDEEVACLTTFFDSDPDAFETLRCETEARRGLLECALAEECPGSFTCDDGASIPEALACDGIDDCVDASDEDSRCETELCADGTTTIRPSWICDVVPDCPSGSDESGCPADFRCGDGQTIPGIWVCDNIVHCPDGADEREDCPYECERTWSLQLIECEELSEAAVAAVDECLEVICIDGTVFESSRRCDGTPDCSEGEDESFCDEG